MIGGVNLKLALVQMEVLEKNKAGNVEKACHLLKQAAPQADIAEPQLL